MNGKRIGLALVVAVVLAVVVTVAFARYIAARQESSPVLHRYVAAKSNIAAGQTLKKSDLMLIKWDSKSPLSGAFTTVHSVAGRVAIYPISAGEPVLPVSLSSPGSGMGLAGKIPPGMRAIAIKTDDVSGVDGFLFPGCHVDILVTYHSPNGPGWVTNTVLQDVTVLAAGHETEPNPSGKPKTASVVTVLVSPKNAQRIALATAEGKIHFVLRNGSDSAHLPTAPMEMSRFAAPPQQIRRSFPRPVYHPPAHPRKAATKKDEPYINTYLGGENKVETTKF